MIKCLGDDLPVLVYLQRGLLRECCSCEEDEGCGKCCNAHGFSPVTGDACRGIVVARRPGRTGFPLRGYPDRKKALSRLIV